MIKPTGFRVLAKVDAVQKEHKVNDKISIALAVDEKMEKGAMIQGNIIALGPLAFLAHQVGPNGEHIGKPWVKVGDRVFWAKYAGKIIKDKKGEEFLILNDDDILAVEV